LLGECSITSWRKNFAAFWTDNFVAEKPFSQKQLEDALAILVTFVIVQLLMLPRHPIQLEYMVQCCTLYHVEHVQYFCTFTDNETVQIGGALHLCKLLDILQRERALVLQT